MKKMERGAKQAINIIEEVAVVAVVMIGEVILFIKKGNQCRGTDRAESRLKVYRNGEKYTITEDIGG